MHLPQISLTHFEGELADWPDFLDRFTALVHSRSNISNVEKFYYLVGCLSSDASEAIKGIMVSSETYEIACAALVERYDMPRKLASRLLESMFSATPITHNESVISLNKFLNIFDENIAILNSLEIPDLGDFILFSLAFRELPTSSRRLFETTNQEVYPQSQDLFKFVRNRVQVLELAGGGSSPLVLKNPSLKSAKFGTGTTGRFSVPLPFKQGQEFPEFKGMRRIAGRRFELLERKLERDVILGDAYRTFMAEYESLGHMIVAQEPGRYIIPHHAVWKRNGDQGKLRVVFDASARCETGQSLNDALYVGPKLQRDIVDVLLGFRLFRYAFSSDICKMYRQILVNSEYRKYQHIFWRPTPHLH